MTGTNPNTNRINEQEESSAGPRGNVTAEVTHIEGLEEICETLIDIVGKNSEAFTALKASMDKKGSSGAKLFKEFAGFNPPVFKGEMDPLVIDGWEREMEKLFKVVDVPKEKMVTFASHYLRGNADDWWKLAEKKHSEIIESR